MPDMPLTPEDLAHLRQQYARLSRHSLEQAYSDALERCQLDDRGRPPGADHIQVLVTAWKSLRRMK